MQWRPRSCLYQLLQQFGIENVAAVAGIKKIAPDGSACFFVGIKADEPDPLGG
jgi:hypothetical protein